MSTPARWVPDDQLIAAVIAGSAQTMRSLEPPDRAWLVAGLTAAGWPAEAIAERCGCCLRMVRSILADPLTAVCERLAAESDHFDSELNLLRSELSRMTAAHDALSSHRDRLLRVIARYTSVAEGWPLCGKGLHPLTPYNTYTRTGPNGRTRSWCRECHRDRQARYRARRAAAVISASSPGHDERMLLVSAGD